MNRIFRSDDGAEISEEDIEDAMTWNLKRSRERIRKALLPKTCGAVMLSTFGVPFSPRYRCTLPAGHTSGHMTAPETWSES